jgi:hypothetical protein
VTPVAPGRSDSMVHFRAKWRATMNTYDQNSKRNDMTREQLISAFCKLSGNPYLITQRDVYDDGFHVSSRDLDAMNQKKLVAILKKVKFNVTDKGLWFKI